MSWAELEGILGGMKLGGAFSCLQEDCVVCSSPGISLERGPVQHVSPNTLAHSCELPVTIHASVGWCMQ